MNRCAHNDSCATALRCARRVLENMYIVFTNCVKTTVLRYNCVDKVHASAVLASATD